MQIRTTNEINENLISVKIKTEATGTTTIDSATEINLLHNFPKEIEYSKIKFEGNMKIVDGVPVITTDEPEHTITAQDGTVTTVGAANVATVKIDDLINKKYIIDENLDIEFVIDVTKLRDDEVGTVFDTKEMLGEAKAVLFANKVIDAIKSRLAEIRALSNTFEGEEEQII